jgi:hypothetical protein
MEKMWFDKEEIMNRWAEHFKDAQNKENPGLSVLCVAYDTHSTLKPVPTLPR